MSHTGGDRYDEFVERMLSIVDANFTQTVPLQTTLSPGLAGQTGLIVGAIPDAAALYDLFRSLGDLPTVWSFYEQPDVHFTFGSFENPASPNLTEDYDDLVASVSQFAKNYRGGELKLLQPRLLVNNDTIILSTTPTHATFQARTALLNSVDPRHEEIRKGAWGMHATIARALGQIPDDQRGMTDVWLESQQAKLPHVLRLTDFLVGGFTVSSRRFRFDENRHATFPIS